LNTFIGTTIQCGCLPKCSPGVGELPSTPLNRLRLQHALALLEAFNDKSTSLSPFPNEVVINGH
jgi:hypothetical protein